jgi:hypothetical protein
VSRKFLTNVDLALNAIQNALAHPLSSDPTGLTSGQAGLIWFNTSTSKLMFWNGSTAIDATARANHTGTQLASTISDLASTVQAYRLDQFAAATNPITIVNGTTSNHAVTKSQLDAVAAAAATGTTIKAAVRAVATSNITLSGTQTIDGVSVVAGDRVLAAGQTTASANGIYVVAAGAWSRATDMDATGEVTPGTMVGVTEGSTNGDKLWWVTSDTAITVGTTSMTWQAVPGSTGSTTYTGTAPVQVSGTTISLLTGSGLTTTSNNLVVDSTVARKVTGVIPATTSGIFSVSGAAVTVNHALGNSAPRVTVRYYTSPGSGNTQGALVEVDEVASDANNVVLTFPAAPSANQYVVTVTG